MLTSGVCFIVLYTMSTVISKRLAGQRAIIRHSTRSSMLARFWFEFLKGGLDVLRVAGGVFPAVIVCSCSVQN